MLRAEVGCRDSPHPFLVKGINTLAEGVGIASAPYQTTEHTNSVYLNTIELGKKIVQAIDEPAFVFLMFKVEH